jgi:catechol 2,3-dioxygenase-like lactoylglutathione lyase family enzyme
MELGRLLLPLPACGQSDFAGKRVAATAAETFEAFATRRVKDVDVDVSDESARADAFGRRRGVLQLRLVVEAEDFEQAVVFYRDVLGLPEQAAFQGQGEERVAILDAGRATLEIANPAQKRMIDEVEVGRQVSPRLRVAFEVVDTTASTAALLDAGAILVAPPTVTPWRSLNARLEAPAGLQLTLFQELERLEERSARPGFGTRTPGPDRS